MNASACDLLLTGGLIIDPESQSIFPADVAVRDGKILAVGAGLPFSPSKAIDVSGCYITPGLIDMHCHCFPTFPFAKDSLPTLHPDTHMFQHGVTTAVDAGTSGWKNFPFYYEEIILKSRVRTLAFLNIADRGMVHMTDEDDPGCFHPQITAEVASAYRDAIVGIKTAHYWVHKPFDEVHAPWASVDAMVSAGERCGMPCMADFQPTLPVRTYEKLLLEHLRPGDIHTHMYAPQFSVLNTEGRVQDFLFAAREKGVRFDLGHGAGSFLFSNAIPALRQGFGPDTLSTDLYMDNVAGPVIGLTHIMSKYLCMGMPLEEIIRRVTTVPAEIIRRPELGTLRPGSCADIAILKLRSEPVHFADSSRVRMAGSQIIQCMATLRAGEIVYDPYALSLPDWDAPLA